MEEHNKFSFILLILLLIVITFAMYGSGAELDSIIGTLVLFSLFYSYVVDKLTLPQQKIIKLKENQINDLKREIEYHKSENSKILVNYQKILDEKDALYNSFKENISCGWKYLADLIADFKTIEYDFSVRYLREKRRPAFAEAKRIAELKKETKEYIKELKLMKYKYEYLFKLYPDLEYYIEDLEGFDGDEFSDIDDLEENIDKARKHLSKEEYETLSVDDRNQLALDRYTKSRKTKLQIGLEYEMCTGYFYEKDGWDVEYFGIDKKLEDMGRDLIAKKGNEVHIVQCKYWSKDKTIHEKHICQLFGTMIQYKMENNPKLKIIPIFVTSAMLSETAKKFAKYLDITLEENKPMVDFPRIKCNINKGEKIYHLPFDQQYHRTKIDKNHGEFYAWTVKEAVEKGFRRAKKYYYTNAHQ